MGQAFVITCALIIVVFGFRAPAILAPLLGLSGAIWLTRHVARRRSARLPIFDYRRLAARLARMPSPKSPNRREVFMLAAVGAPILATLFRNHVVPWVE